MAGYTGSNPHYKAGGYTGLGNVEILRETDKSWQVRLSDDQTPFVPKSQFRCVDGLKTPLKVGDRRNLEVKTWLVDKWAKVGAGPAPTFEFDPQDMREELTVHGEEPNDDFLFDYSKKQLIAACTAYRSILQQMTAALETYEPVMDINIEYSGNRGGPSVRTGPDGSGSYPITTYRWSNKIALNDIHDQGNVVLKSLYIGQTMLEKMAAIEELLGEKRADVAAELLRSMDDEED